MENIRRKLVPIGKSRHGGRRLAYVRVPAPTEGSSIMIQHDEVAGRISNLKESRDELLRRLQEVRESAKILEDEILRLEGALTFAHAILEVSQEEEEMRKAIAEKLATKAPEPMTLPAEPMLNETAHTVNGIKNVLAEQPS